MPSEKEIKNYLQPSGVLEAQTLIDGVEPTHQKQGYFDETDPSIRLVLCFDHNGIADSLKIFVGNDENLAEGFGASAEAFKHIPLHPDESGKVIKRNEIIKAKAMDPHTNQILLGGSQKTEARIRLETEPGKPEVASFTVKTKLPKSEKGNRSEFQGATDLDAGKDVHASVALQTLEKDRYTVLHALDNGTVVTLEIDDYGNGNWVVEAEYENVTHADLENPEPLEAIVSQIALFQEGNSVDVTENGAYKARAVARLQGTFPKIEDAAAASLDREAGQQ